MSLLTFGCGGTWVARAMNFPLLLHLRISGVCWWGSTMSLSGPVGLQQA